VLKVCIRGRGGGGRKQPLARRILNDPLAISHGKKDLKSARRSESERNRALERRRRERRVCKGI